MDAYGLDLYSTNYVKCTHNIEMIKMDEIKQLLKEVDETSKKLKITRQEALLLVNTYHLNCIHDHIEKVIFGTLQAHVQEKPEKKRR